MSDWITALYIIAFALFILGLHMLRGPRTAVRGNQVAATGMAIAVIATLLDDRIGDWPLIVVGVAIGTAVGIPAARNVKMTAMPQMVSLIPILFAAIIGSISFWGSNVAFLKLQEALRRGFRIPKAVNAGLALEAVGSAVVIAAGSDSQALFWLI